MKLLVFLFLLTSSLNVLLKTGKLVRRDFQNYRTRRTNYQNKVQYRTLLLNTRNTGRMGGLEFTSRNCTTALFHSSLSDQFSIHTSMCFQRWQQYLQDIVLTRSLKHTPKIRKTGVSSGSVIGKYNSTMFDSTWLKPTIWKRCGTLRN